MLLEQLQGLPLDIKVKKTEQRIIEFYEHFHGQVYVAFSGGKDSTVLLHIARSIYPDIKACFVDTGLEYKEIRDFVKSTANVDIIRPKMQHREVIEKYGYPVISKEQSQYIYEYRNTKSEKLRSIRINGDAKGGFKISERWKYLLDAPFNISDKCCHYMKKNPFWNYEKQKELHPIIGTMTCESSRRKTDWGMYGCNSFIQKRPSSKPLSFWLEEDIWEYIKTNNVNYSEIYNIGYDRTGCAFCLFGCQFDDFKKFDTMSVTHPKLCKYILEDLGVKEVIRYIRGNTIFNLF